eukprot:m.1400990 g.1400990  ORF g.1400990 m.1400990 type:complete len:504 (-) comp25007_c0_seq11:3568-5079(-)
MTDISLGFNELNHTHVLYMSGRRQRIATGCWCVGELRVPCDCQRRAVRGRCTEYATLRGGVTYHKPRPRTPWPCLVCEAKHVVLEKRRGGIKRESAGSRVEIDRDPCDGAGERFDKETHGLEIDLAVITIARESHHRRRRRRGNVAGVAEPPESRMLNNIRGGILRHTVEAKPRVATVGVVVHDKRVGVEPHGGGAVGVDVAHESGDGTHGGLQEVMCIGIASISLDHGNAVEPRSVVLPLTFPSARDHPLCIVGEVSPSCRRPMPREVWNIGNICQNCMYHTLVEIPVNIAGSIEVCTPDGHFFLPSCVPIEFTSKGRRLVVPTGAAVESADRAVVHHGSDAHRLCLPRCITDALVLQCYQNFAEHRSIHDANVWNAFEGVCLVVIATERQQRLVCPIEVPLPRLLCSDELEIACNTIHGVICVDLMREIVYAVICRMPCFGICVGCQCIKGTPRWPGKTLVHLGVVVRISREAELRGFLVSLGVVKVEHRHQDAIVVWLLE